MLKISIGFTFKIPIKSYRELFSVYGRHISDIYFNLPFSPIYSTRKKEAKIQQQHKDPLSYLTTVLDLARSYEIKGNLVVNTHNDLPKLEEDLIAFRKYWKPDIITTHSRHLARIAGDVETPIVFSFNGGLTKNSVDLPPGDWSAAVMGGPFIRDFSRMEELRLQRIKPIVLLNNGCSTNCYTFCNPSTHCRPLFLSNLDKCRDINYLYALQSVVPSDIPHYIAMGLTEFKTSNRPCTYQYLNGVLDSYINYERFHWSDVNIFDTHRMWCRLAYFTKYRGLLDKEKIMEYKEIIWANNGSEWVK